ncbi:MAG: hypothetical protein JO311_04215, partial [Candidatus Eremiobacteraeota bacterium]|nr:hypothetical protein [Candidatus Eremiobacteraeota bacterium]
SKYPDGTVVCPHRYNGRPIHWVHDDAILGNSSTETALPGYAEIAGLDCDLKHDGAAFSAANRNVYGRNAYALRVLRGDYFSWVNAVNDARTWQQFGQDRGSTFLRNA